eukprot:6862797-Ditylum_brightwellii.AAC.1
MRSVITPSEFLKADADILLQVEAICKELGYTISTQYVKGHQDKSNNAKESSNTTKNSTKKQHRITWEACLNIQADMLTTQAQQKITFKDTTRTIDMLPACQAHLMIKDKMITRQFKQNSREA